VPADLVKRIDLDALYPPLLERVLDMLARCRALGADYYAVAGFRTYEQQAKLYFQGRTMPGAKVTNARPGESAHNFGLAVDFCRDGYLDRAGLQPDYRPESYELLGRVAGDVGLEWGGNWRFRDLPHCQWPGYVSAAELRPIKRVFEAEGLQQAWRLIDGAARPVLGKGAAP
jgi:peptidoglycan LD-endopeptidase CwlK